MSHSSAPIIRSSGATTNMELAILSAAAASFIEGEFHNLRWASVIVTVANPSRPGPKVEQGRPARPMPAIGKGCELKLLQPIQCGARRLIGNALVLHGALVSGKQPANDESDLGIAAQILHFAGSVQGVE